MKGKVLYEMTTFFGKRVLAYMPVVGEEFGPWLVTKVGEGPFIGQSWNGYSWPDGTELDAYGMHWVLTGVKMDPQF